MRIATGLLLLLASAFAAEEEFLRLGAPGEGVRARVLAVPGASGAGATGFVRFSLENEGRVAQRVDLLLRDERSPARIRIRTHVAVEPGATAVAFLPVPGDSVSYEVELSAAGATRTTAIWLGGRSPLRRPAFLLVAPSAAVGARRRDVLEGALARRGPDPAWRRAGVEELPSDWRLLTGFRTFVLGGADPGWTASRQAVVAAALEAGARVLVFRADALPDGPLARLVAAAPGVVRSGRRGLGAFLGLGFDRDGLRRRAAGRGPAWTAARDWLAREPSRATWLPAGLFRAVAIPGVGDVPVRAFFLLILGFAVLVGPVAYLWLRRRRQLTLMVAVVPGTGLLLTAAILVFGFFSEGFGVKGAVRSFTVLDQRAHVATTAAGRTLYAGLSPEALERGAGTTVFCPPLAERRAPHVLERRGARIDGALLPSRTPTPLVTLQSGRARERLRFRRRGDGWEVLSEEAFAPVDGGLLFHDPAGRWWRDAGGGRLERLPGGPDRALAVLRTRFLRGFGPDAARRTLAAPDLPAWTDAVTRAAARPGSYVARMRSLPSLDGLGLDVAVVASEHLVVGVLGPEDLVE